MRLNRLGWDHILATVAHNLCILHLHCGLVVNYVSCWMQNGGEAAEYLEMAAVKMGNNTHAADEIEWCLCQQDCLC